MVFFVHMLIALCFDAAASFLKVVHTVLLERPQSPQAETFNRQASDREAMPLGIRGRTWGLILFSFIFGVRTFRDIRSSVQKSS